MPRETTIITSIRSDTFESVNVDSTDWTTDFGTITLSATVPAAVNIGDLINDSAGNDYLITDIAGAVLTCNEFSTTTDPATGSATITEAYDTITLWEADLDAGTNVEAYKSGNDAVGECYDTTTFTDVDITLNGGATIGLNSIKLTAPESERHDGTKAGGGVTIDCSGNRFFILGAVNNRKLIIEWLVVIDWGAGSSNKHAMSIGASGQNHEIRNCVLDGGTSPHPTCVNGLTSSRTTTKFHNNIILNLAGSNSAGNVITSEFGVVDYYNNTIFNCSGAGITADNSGGEDVRNNIVFDCGDDDFDETLGTFATEDFNCSSDTTAEGANSLISKTAANQFVSILSGTEDLHLKPTGTDVVDQGFDLEATLASTVIDINGNSRTSVTNWDMGAHEVELDVPPPVGLPIPVAMNSYRQHHQSVA